MGNDSITEKIVQESGLMGGLFDRQGDTYTAQALETIAAAMDVPVYINETPMWATVRDMPAIPRGMTLAPAFLSKNMVFVKREEEHEVGLEWDEVEVVYWLLLPEGESSFRESDNEVVE